MILEVWPLTKQTNKKIEAKVDSGLPYTLPTQVLSLESYMALPSLPGMNSECRNKEPGVISSATRYDPKTNMKKKVYS